MKNYQDTRINRYLDKAISLLEGDESIRKDIFKDKAIQKEYPGYIASFGANIVQCGLLPAVFLYSQTDGSGKNKKPLLNCIKALVAEDDPAAKQASDLLSYVRKRVNNGDPFIEKRIKDATVALKLAMRTFPIAKSQNS